MSIQTRAKFRCISETRHCFGSPESRTYKFQAIYDDSIPEDQRYAKYTPTGTLEMVVDNPSVEFAVGAYYYLDFTPADVELVAQ